MESRHELRQLYPHLAESELLSAAEALRRYVELAAQTAISLPPLTESVDGVNVRAGAVDPGTFKTKLG
jgi:hypothetical protein